MSVVLETTIVHGFAALRWLDGSTGDQGIAAVTPLGISEVLSTQLDTLPRGLQVLSRRGGLAFSFEEAATVPGRANAGELTPPARAAVALGGIVGARDGEGAYLPRRFKASLTRGAATTIVVYPTPGRTRAGGGGALFATCTAPDERPVPWAVLTLSVTVPPGGVRTFRAQADARGDVVLAPRRLPPLPQGVAVYAATLSVHAGPPLAAGASVGAFVDPVDLDELPPARLRPVAAPGPATASIPLQITPGTTHRLTSGRANDLDHRALSFTHVPRGIPSMPEYLAPGVFVEETSFRAKSIEGVGTSVAALVGPTRYGPLRGVPEVVTSFAEFGRIFGDAADLVFGGKAVPNDTALAARAFFDNGGKQLFVSRVLKGVNVGAANGDGGSGVRSQGADANSRVTFRGRYPGRYGNLTLELRWRDSENLLKVQAVAGSPSKALLIADNVPAAAFMAAPAVVGVAATDVLSIRALVTLTGNTYTVDGTKIIIRKAGAGTPVPDAQPAALELTVASLPAGHRLVRLAAKRPASGDLADGTAATLTFSAPLAGLDALGVSLPPGLTTLRGTLNAAGTEFQALPAPLTPGLGAPVTIELLALAAAPDVGSFLIVNRTFDIDVLNGGKDGEVVYTYAGISAAISGDDTLSARLPAVPAKRSDRLASPVSAAITPGTTADQIIQLSVALFPAVATLDGTRFLMNLTGGSDGDEPVATDYAGESDSVKGSTGLASLEDVEDISIVATPFAATAATAAHTAVVLELQKHVRKMRYRIGLVDSEAGMSISEVRALRSSFDDSRLALYYPYRHRGFRTATAPRCSRRPRASWRACTLLPTWIAACIRRPPTRSSSGPCASRARSIAFSRSS